MNKRKGILITTDNQISVIEVSNANMFSHVSKEIGCDLVEIVHPEGLPRPYVMLVDEEGRYRIPLFVNLTGSFLYGFHIHGEPIVGNIAIFKEGYVNGEPDIVGLDDEELSKLYLKLKTEFNLKEKKS